MSKHKNKFPEITTDAKHLGVCRTHLYRVLTGKRQSASLTRRYRELQKSKRKGATA